MTRLFDLAPLMRKIAKIWTLLVVTVFFLGAAPCDCGHLTESTQAPESVVSDHSCCDSTESKTKQPRSESKERGCCDCGCLIARITDPYDFVFSPFQELPQVRLFVGEYLQSLTVLWTEEFYAQRSWDVLPRFSEPGLSNCSSALLQRWLF